MKEALTMFMAVILAVLWVGYCTKKALNFEGEGGAKIEWLVLAYALPIALVLYLIRQ